MNERLTFAAEPFELDPEFDKSSALSNFELEDGEFDFEADGYAELDGEDFESTASQCKCEPSKTNKKENEESGDMEWFDQPAPSGEDEALAEKHFESGMQGTPLPTGPFGTLSISEPSRRFSYVFTREDVLWTARFLVGEAGGRNDLDNQAVVWAMFNRYAFFTRKYYKTYHIFIRAYSTPLQPVLRSWGAARRHMHKPDFVRTEGFYKPPHSDIPKGQLRNFLNLQKRPWEKLPTAARELALNALTGKVPNPIGNVSEFGSTYVYFRDRHRRNPDDKEWREFTVAYARQKKWQWIGPVSGLNQKKNAFFVQLRVAALPRDTVRVLPPPGPRQQGELFAYGAELEDEWLEEHEDDCPDCAEIEPELSLEEEFQLNAFPKPVLDAFRSRNKEEVIKRAAQSGRSAGEITNLLFFMNHPERINVTGVGRPLTEGEPNYKRLREEWLDLYATVPGPHPEIKCLMPKRGVGFFCRKEASKRYGLRETIRALKAVAARWSANYTNGPRIVISDISKRGGGWLSPHKSHQVGLDVDIGVIRKNNQSTEKVTYKTGNYSQERTRELIERIFKNGVLPVQMIFFNDPAIKHPQVKYSSGHDGHLHVRFCMPPYYPGLRQRIPKKPNYRVCWS
jgi:Penicillin-insensitive murein endopeptidase